MKKIFIVDEHQSSKQNGIGTFVGQMVNCLSTPASKISLISFDSDVKQFTVGKRGGVMDYQFPSTGNHGFRFNGALHLSVLRLYIPDDRENMFFVNHSPCLPFLKALRQLFPKSKIVFIVHNQGWCDTLRGNKEALLKCVHHHKPAGISDKEFLFIRKYLRQEKAMYRLADKIVCLSASTHEVLTEIYKLPDDKVAIIPNGMTWETLASEPNELIKERLGLGRDEIILFYAGRTQPAKGVYELLGAFDEVFQSERRLRLVIAGEVYDLNNFASLTKHSASHVTYLGLIGKESIRDWYRISDITILPSYTEQCSYTGLEMMASGQLIITTDGHGLKDMFDAQNAVIAHITWNGSKNGLQTELVRCINVALGLSETERDSLRENAGKRFRDVYNIRAMKEKYIRLING